MPASYRFFGVFQEFDIPLIMRKFLTDYFIVDYISSIQLGRDRLNIGIENLFNAQYLTAQSQFLSGFNEVFNVVGVGTNRIGAANSLILPNPTISATTDEVRCREGRFYCESLGCPNPSDGLGFGLLVLSVAEGCVDIQFLPDSSFHRDRDGE